MTKTFDDFGIHLHGKTGIEVQTTCPECSASRKKQNVKCLSVNTDKGVWVCHHCGWVGTLKAGSTQPSRPPKVVVRPTYQPKTDADPRLLAWGESRGLTVTVLVREGVGIEDAYLPQVEDTVPCLVFPYRKGGEIVNCKYRGLHEKAFRQVAGAEKVLYRQDMIAREQVVITEGEVDALSVVTAGIESVVSVPDGAPMPTVKNYQSKFSYLDQEHDPFDGVQKIILAVDNDAPGHALEEELARRLGRDRCYRVTWPEGCKDANDVLVQQGREALLSCLNGATPWPIEDVVTVDEASDAVVRLYLQGQTRGHSTGWANVDALYTVEPGQLTIVTGIPSHGKSELLDALMIQLATLHGWRFAVCSPENWPLATHLAKLCEKVTGRAFPKHVPSRMSSVELGQALQWLHQHVTFIVPSATVTIDAVLQRATSLVRRQGIQGLLLDPYNEFDHTRPKGMSETEYICEVLGLLKRWARQWSVHVWVVAHPQKLYRREDGSYPVPTPYDISGSAHWRNRADNCLTIWRDVEQPDQPTQVHVQKVRFKHIGQPGLAHLTWEPINGRYTPALTEGDSHATPLQR